MPEQFDTTAARRLETIYQTPDIVAQRAATLAALSPQPGERVVDVGSGPGLLVADVARAVGPAGHVTGVDSSDAMVEVARRRCDDPTIRDRVTVLRGDAVALPLADASCDAAVSTQVLEYVAEVDTAIAELRRVLRPGGRVVILDTDWDSVVWHSSDPARMRTVLTTYQQRFADPHLPRTLGRRLRDHGFRIDAHRVHVILNPDYAPDTYSAGNIAGMAKAAVEHGVSAEVATAWQQDLEQLGCEGRYFFSLNRYVFAATRVSDVAV